MKTLSSILPLKIVILLACLSGPAATAFATTVTIPSDDDMIVGARLIVRARVLSVSSRLDQQQDRIYTYITLRVQETLKGERASRKIVLKEEGGIVRERGSVVFGTPKFEPGERVMLYLCTWPDGSLRTYQMFLGKFSILTDAGTNQEFAVREAPDGNTVVLNSLAGRGARGAITNRAELSAYRALVRARVAASHGQSEEFEARYYRGIPLRAQPPEYEGAMEGGELEPCFTYLSPTEPARWFEPDGGNPVVFTVNPEGAFSPQTFDDVVAAMNVWSTIPGCSLRVAGTSGGGCYARESNTIVFDNCDGWFVPSPGCDGTLARGGFSWDRNVTRVVGGITFFKAYAGHVSFNPYASCYFEDHCSVREIATHELGHALGLGHSRDPDATMYGYAHFDGRCSSLREDDTNGIISIYPGPGGGPTPVTILTSSPLSAATIGAAYNQTLIATGGLSPYTWTILEGVQALPPGLRFHSSGVINGSPSTPGTHTFTLRATDSRSISAEKQVSITAVMPGTDLNSQFVSQTVPANLQPGQPFNVRMRWNNMGTDRWNGPAGLKLVSQNPAGNTTWGGHSVQLTAFLVEPGSQLDLNFTAYAPSRPGTYNFQWQLSQGGINFGQLSANVVIQVGGGDEGTSDAAFVSQSVPHTMNGGHSHTVSVVMRNTGTATWNPGEYKLGAQNPQDNNLWGLNRVNLPGPVAPGAAGAFIFDIIAPAAPGAYNFQWQMMKEGLGFFGQLPPNVTINVTQAGPPPEIITTSLPAAVSGSAYAHLLSATGGVRPYTWSIKAGALPAGLALDAATGRVSGTASAIGSFPFTIKVTDSASRSAERPLAITVSNPPPPISMITSSMPGAVRGTFYNIGLVATGGALPYTWAISAGALPAGLALNTTSGTISGVPTTSGNFGFTVTVRDQRSASASALIYIQVAEPLPVPNITRVKYHAGKKRLTVMGELFDPAVRLVLNGVEVSASVRSSTIQVKRIVLVPGRHLLLVVNPGGASSAPYIFYVN